MFRRRRGGRTGSQAGNASTTPRVPVEAPVNSLPPGTPGVQIFGENYAGPRVLEETDFHKTLGRNTKIGTVLKSVRIQRAIDPIERLKIQLKELDLAFEEGTLDQFQFAEAKRLALEDAKRSIADRKKATSARIEDVEVNKEVDKELEENEEVQTLLLNSTIVSAVPFDNINHNPSINQSDDLIVAIQSEEENELLEELRQMTTEEPTQTQPQIQNEPQTETQSPNQDENQTFVVSAFVIEDISDQNEFVLGEQDFLIENEPDNDNDGHSEIIEVENNNNQTTTVVAQFEVEENEGNNQTKTFVAQVNVEETENIEAARAVVGGSFLFTSFINENDNEANNEMGNEDDEMAFLMGDLTEQVKEKKKSEVHEKEQAKQFNFKKENPPNRAKEVEVELKSKEKAVVVTKPVVVKESFKLTDPDEEEKSKSVPNGGFFLDLTATTDQEESKNVNEEDEMALLMAMEEAPKPKVKPQPKQAPTRRVKPLTPMTLGQRAAMPKLNVKQSKQAPVTKADEDAFDFLMSNEAPKKSKKNSTPAVVNNAFLLVPEEESETETDEDLRFAGPAKPVFITTATTQVVKKPKKPKKAAKQEFFYRTDGFESNAAVGKVTKESRSVEVRSHLVHGLINQMEKEAKTGKQCLESLQDLKKWGTITQNELDLAKEILIRTNKLNV